MQVKEGSEAGVSITCGRTNIVHTAGSVLVIEGGFIQKRRQRSSLLFGRHDSFNSLPR